MFSFNRTIRVLLILALAMLCGAASAENTLEVPASTRVIQAEAFANVKTARAVTLPEGIQEIHSRAFANSSITSINLPSTLTFIADDAFANSSLTTVTADKGTYAYNWAVASGYIAPESSPIEDFKIEDGVLKRYIGNGGDVVIPNSVTSIGELAFESCTSLTNVTIPNSVTSIGNRAFEDCTSLTNVTIPNSVTSIRERTFENCASLTNVTIPNSVTSIGHGTFASCTSLTNVTIPNSVTSIWSSVFFSCASLTNVTIPNSVTSIGSSAFAYCTSLTNVTIPNSVTSIGAGTFENCASLTNVTIPNSVTSIGNEAFCRCTSLTNVTIPNSVTSIGDGAFRYCTSLTNVTIPNSVTRIGGGAFRYCTSLTSVTIPNSVTSIGYEAFAECTSLTNVTIPNSVTSIRNRTFYGCTSLTNVTIPNSVTSIDDDAFAYCDKLKTINLEKGSYAETWAKNNGYQCNYYNEDTPEKINVPEHIYLGAGQSYVPKITFENGVEYDYVLISSNENCIMIEDNKLIGVNGGTATITVVAGDRSATFKASTCLCILIEQNTMGVYGSQQLIDLWEILPTLPVSSLNVPLWKSSDKTILSVSDDGYITALKEGTVTITCTAKVNNDTHEADNDKLVASCKITVLSNQERELRDAFYEELRTLKKGENPLDNAIIYKAMYDALVVADSGDHSQMFAQRVLEYVKNAPSVYRDIYVYSFFEYDRYLATDEKSSNYNPNSNAILIKDQYSPGYRNGEMALKNYDNDILSVWFHESGHAADSVAVAHKKIWLTDITKDKLKETMRTDVCNVLSLVMAKYQSENNNLLDSQTILKLFTAILDHRNKNSTYNEENNEYIINKPKGEDIDESFCDLYKDFIEYSHQYFKENYEFKRATYYVSGDWYLLYTENNCMMFDMIGGITNNAIICPFGHDKKYYWYDFWGNWTNNQAKEAWAEYFSSMIMQLDENVKANHDTCPNTCKYFDEIVAPFIRKHFVEKVRGKDT